MEPDTLKEAESKKNPLDELLDKVEAICSLEKGLLADLGRAVLPDSPRRATQHTRVSEWVRARTRRPNGEYSLRMEKWAAGQIVKISKDKEKAEAFRQAFKEVQIRRNGQAS